MLDNKEIERQLTRLRIEQERVILDINNLQRLYNNIKEPATVFPKTEKATEEQKILDYNALDAFYDAPNARIIHRLKHLFQKVVTFLSGIITGLIYPLTDSTTAIVITKADGTTVILTVDTTNSRVGIGVTPTAKLDVKDGYIRGRDGANTTPSSGQGMEMFGTGGTGYLQGYNRDGAVYIPIVIRGTEITIGESSATTAMSFWGATPAAKQTLNAYTPDTESSAYTGTTVSSATIDYLDHASSPQTSPAFLTAPSAGTVLALLSEVNQLRVAYENLRVSYDDLRTKLKNTTLVS